MRHSGHYRTGVVTARVDTSATDLADRMDMRGVGAVVVVDDERRPLGIVTDRDLTRRVVAHGREGGKTRAADVMTTDLETAGVDEPLERLLDRMRAREVRRIPIVEDGRLVGLVSHDDLVAELGAELSDIREAYRAEVLGGRRGARRRRARERVEELLEEMRSEAVQMGSESLEWIQQEVESLRSRLGR